MKIFQNRFSGKSILITGHSGFKGSWLGLCLKYFGARCYGLSDQKFLAGSIYARLANSLWEKEYFLDVRDPQSVKMALNEIRPDFVFHLAAQSLTGVGYSDPHLTFTTNVGGTSSILSALVEYDDPVVVVMITSDKVYQNKEWLYGYRENDTKWGEDPYSASKSCAELTIESYQKAFFLRKTRIRVASARAGNVVGGGDIAVGRLIPDCVACWSDKKPVVIKSPNATRPWQHVLEPIGGYLRLALAMHENGELAGESYNFGPSADDTVSVREFAEKFKSLWSGWSEIKIEDSDRGFKEATLLSLNCEKARQELGWRSTISWEECLQLTCEWYETSSRAIASQEDLEILTDSQIQSFFSRAKYA